MNVFVFPEPVVAKHIKVIPIRNANGAGVMSYKDGPKVPGCWLLGHFDFIVTPHEETVAIPQVDTAANC